MLDQLETTVGVAALAHPPRGAASPYEATGLVSALVREALLAAGLGRHNPRAPLSDLIHPGANVLLKPNWVLHYNQSGRGMDCMVTHPAVILAVLKEVMAAQPGRVVIGDAPIQACDFAALVTPAFSKQVAEIAACPVEIIDFRRTILSNGKLDGPVITDARPADRYILFDLAGESLLEPLAGPQNPFRITCYNPEELARTHGPGRHQYLLSREIFEADVVLNLPKLKTHKKAGLTAALKNLVGANGNKDYLPHHRIGGSALGGDCYPGFSPIKSVVEYCYDQANRQLGTSGQARWRSRAAKLMAWQRRWGNAEIEGGWQGNDTVWRMVLDLNRLLRYGRLDGTLAKAPQRRLYSLTDAIIAGEGNGPLAPTPVFLGALTFAYSSPFNDLVNAALMRFNWQALPLVREAFGKFSYPLTQARAEDCKAVFRNRELTPAELGERLGKKFAPPSGWQGALELN